MKARHLALACALALAAWLALFGDKSPATEVVEPARPTPVMAARRPATRPQAPAIMRLQPRETLIGDDADAFGAGPGDGFGAHNWTPPPPPPPPAPVAPPAPPQAPPLPFTVIGKSLQEGRWEVFLARGEQTWLVHEKDVIDGSWRVDAIKPPLMILTYVPLEQVRQLNIGVFD